MEKFSTKGLYVSLIFLFLYLPQSYAQMSVRGTVKDAAGVTLPGVSVKLSGTTLGASTNENGRYELSIPDLKGTLEFTYLGFVKQTVPIDGRREIDVVLASNETSLEEVIVVGYGTQTKGSVAGAVSQISGEQLRTTQTSDVINMMAGKMPGLRVAQKTGSPGNYTAVFDIRGYSTAGNTPALVLVDGVEVQNPRSIDPSEVESVSILKDASAAVYGIRAANGVILITTKKGVAGKTSFNYTGTGGIAQITRENKPLGILEWAELHNEARYNGGATGIAGGYNATVNNGQVSIAPRFTAQQLDDFRTGKVQGTNWYDAIIQRNAPMTSHNLSASGGSETIKYFSSLGYLMEDGLWKSGDENFKKYTFRSNITAQLSKSLEAQLLVSGIQSLRKEPNETEAGVINITLRPDPDQTLYANNNPNYLNILPSADNRHPIAGTYADVGGYRNVVNKNFIGQFALTYRLPFVNGLSIKGEYGLNNSVNVNKNWRKAYTLYTYDKTNDTYNPTRINGPSTLTQGFQELERSTMRASLNYNKQMGASHSLKSDLIFERINYKLDNFTGSKRFNLDAVDQLYAGVYDGSQTITSAGTVQTVNMSVIGRVNYSYKGKYILEGTFNQNGSSKFGPGRQWGFFPAGLAAWRVSEEKFIKDKLPYVTNLKLRASVGKMGDDAASTYQWLTGYTYPGAIYVFADANGTAFNATPAVGFKSQANPDITWFNSTTTDIGIDGSLWNDRLSFTFDVFKRYRRGLLATQIATIPGTVGTTLPQVNLNSDESRGWELELGHRNSLGKFSYGVAGNVAFARNIRRKWDHSPYTNSFTEWRQNPENRLYGIVFGYDVEGQFQSFDEIKKSPIQDNKGNQIFLPGDIKYQDFNEDGIIDDNDVHAIGRNDPAPEINFGTTFDMAWKGFDMNIHFSGGTSFFVRYSGLHLESPLTYGNNGYEAFYDRWHRSDPNNPNSDWVPGKYPSTRILGSGEAFNINHLNSTYWYHNAQFIKLKSAELGYTLPLNLVKKAGIKSVRLYATGFNLLTFSKLKLVDPELWNSQFGLEYPITRNYNFGLNISL